MGWGRGGGGERRSGVLFLHHLVCSKTIEFPREYFENWWKVTQSDREKEQEMGRGRERQFAFKIRGGGWRWKGGGGRSGVLVLNHFVCSKTIEFSREY